MRPVHILIVEDEARSSLLAKAVSRLAQGSSILAVAPRAESLVQARDEDTSNVVHCFSSSLPSMEGDTLPDSIQLFPPGKHTIYPSKDGKPTTLTVSIDAKLSDVIRRDFMEIMSRAQADQGPKPFLDFNHDDREASAWVQDVYWAGEDPKTGGIRAKVEWSKPGAEAVSGKAYRQFSPNFRVSKDTGEIVGTSANMGGLVNRPAFCGIEPFFAKDGGADGSNQHQKKVNTMNKLQAALIAAGLLSAVVDDESAAITDFNGRWGTVNAKLSKLPDAEKQVTDLSAKVTAKDAEIKSANDRYTSLADKHAETVVAKAVDDLILAPKDEDAKARWKTMIKADPANADLLRTFNVAAKAGAVVEDPTKTVVQNGSGNTQANAAGALKSGQEHGFTVLAKAVQEREKCDANKALIIAAKENPAAYEAYRTGILFVAEPGKK